MFKKFELIAAVLVSLIFVITGASYAETVYDEAEAANTDVVDEAYGPGKSNDYAVQKFWPGSVTTWTFTLETVYNVLQGDNHNLWLRIASWDGVSSNQLYVDGIGPYYLPYTNGTWDGYVAGTSWMWLNLGSIIHSSDPGAPEHFALKPGKHTVSIVKGVYDNAVYDALLVTPDMTLIPAGMAHPGLKADGNLLLEAEYSNKPFDSAELSQNLGVVDESSGPGKSGNYAVQKFWAGSGNSWNFTVSQSGSHILWVRLASWDPGESANSLFVDGVESYLQYTNGTWNGYLAGTSWKWLNLGTFSLTAGDHRVSIRKNIYDNAVYDALLVTTNQGSCHQVLEAEKAYKDAVASIVADTGASGGYAVSPLSGYDVRFIFIASTAGTYDVSIVHKALSPFTSGNISGSIFIDNEGTQNGELSNVWQHAKPTTFEPRSIGSFTLSAGPHIIRIHTAPQFWMAMDALIVSNVDGDGDSYTTCEGDCDDTNASVYPGAPELCDGKDNNCNGQVDEGLTFDVDGDGHSTPGSCVGTKDDCDDNDASIYPGACEIAGDGIDQNCDGFDVPDAPICADGADGSGNGLWKNHGQFVSTITNYYDTYGTLLCLTGAQIDDAISAAAKSDCGMPGEVSRTQPGKGIGRQ